MLYDYAILYIGNYYIKYNTRPNFFQGPSYIYMITMLIKK